MTHEELKNATDLYPSSWVPLPEPKENEIYLRCGTVYFADEMRFKLMESIPKSAKKVFPEVTVYVVENGELVKCADLMPINKRRNFKYSVLFENYLSVDERRAGNQIIIKIKSHFDIAGIDFNLYDDRKNERNFSKTLLEFSGNMPNATIPFDLSFASNLIFFALNGPNKLESGNSMFYKCGKLKAVFSLDTSHMESAKEMFAGCYNLKSICDLDFSSVEDMSIAFHNCESLTSINLTSTKKAKYFPSAFACCQNLKKVSGLDTTSGQNLSYMFEGCTSLEEISLLDIGAVDQIYNIFGRDNIYPVEKLDVTGEYQALKRVLLHGGYYRLKKSSPVWRIALEDSQKARGELIFRIKLEYWAERSGYRGVLDFLDSVGAINVSEQGRLLSCNFWKDARIDRRIFRVINTIIKDLREKEAEREYRKYCANFKADASTGVENNAANVEPEEGTDVSIKYYFIDERLAKKAKNMCSLSEYEPKSATAEYRAAVNQVAALVEKKKTKVSRFYHEKLDALLDLYAQRLADWTNRYNRNAASCPSILVCGTGDFPTSKKEKENKREAALWAEYDEIEKILSKIQSIETGSVNLTDQNARQELESRLQSLQDELENGKKMNAHFRKYETMQGFSNLSTAEAAEIDEKIEKAPAFAKAPYPKFRLTSIRGKIKRTQERLEKLDKLNTAEGQPNKEESFNGGHIVYNAEEDRLQICFDNIPGEALRSELKGHGFRWSTKSKAWQRQLTENAIRDARTILGRHCK